MILKKEPGNKTKIQNIKLKDRLDFFNQHIFVNAENPIEKLRFKKSETKKSNTLWLTLVVAILMSTSIVLNSFFIEKCDLLLVGTFKNLVNFFNNQISKPYVVTMGEFSNFDSAKKEAIELLPKLHQINIKGLKNMIYTFEIERFPSKNNAYLLANEFTKNGFESMHVRYLKK